MKTGGSDVNFGTVVIPAFVRAHSAVGTVSSFDHCQSNTDVPIARSASWEVDLFGKLLNAESKKALLLQSKAYQQVVKTKVIANIANTYYTLLMLDKQLEISLELREAWKQSVETTRKLMTIGVPTRSAVSSTGNKLFECAGFAGGTAPTDSWNGKFIVALTGSGSANGWPWSYWRAGVTRSSATGVPVQLLANRPDVKQRREGGDFRPTT